MASKANSWTSLLLVGVPVFLLLIVAVQSARRPNGFASTSRILVTKKRPTHLAHPTETDRSAGLANELLRSDELILAAIERGKLDQLESMEGKPEVAKEILKGLTVFQIEDTDVLQIDFVSTNAKDAQRVVAAVTSVFREHLEQDGEAEFAEPMARMRQRMEQAGSKLEAAEAELATAEAELVESDADHLPSQTGSEVTKQYSAAVAQAEAELEEYESKQAAIKKALETNPDADTKRQILQEILELDSPPGNVESRVVALNAATEGAKLQLASLRTKLANVTATSLEWQRKHERVQVLRETIKTEREAYSAAREKLKDLSLSRSYTGTRATIIAPASPGKRVESGVETAVNELSGFFHAD